MGVIGSLGPLVFRVSRKTVRTLDELEWESSTKFAVHDRHIQDQLVEYTGTSADKITFKIFLYRGLGVEPINDLALILNQIERPGQANYLIIGPKAYGKHKWVITGTKKSSMRFTGSGELMAALVEVSLLAYSER